MYQAYDDSPQERRRRYLYIVFAAGMALSAAICAVLMYVILLPGAPLVRLGPESRFAGATARPVDVAVRQLRTSELIPNRPTLSDDVVFVVRDAGVFRAFLGVDPQSGCFLSWSLERQLYVDACALQSYGFTGRNTDQLTTADSRPVNMVELPVTVQDGVLFVEDRILRRDLR